MFLVIDSPFVTNLNLNVIAVSELEQRFYERLYRREEEPSVYISTRNLSRIHHYGANAKPRGPPVLVELASRPQLPRRLLSLMTMARPLRSRLALDVVAGLYGVDLA